MTLLLVGLFSGTYGSLIGAGGGFIIVPVLLFMFPDKAAASITAISLVAVFFNGVSGATAYARLRRIDYRNGLLFLAATIPGAILGAIAVSQISRGIFQLIFGSILLLVGSYVLLRPKKSISARQKIVGSPSRVVDAKGNVYEYRVNRRLGFIMNLGIGFLAGLLGVGGGIMNVPTFVLLLNIPIQVATATSQFMLVGTSFAANVTNFLKGSLHGQWLIVVALTIGSIAGAQIGPRISQRFASAWLARALALGLLIVGIRLIISGAEGL